MIVPIGIFLISALEIALANIHRDVLVLVSTLVSEWVPGIRSLFQTILLNHLPQEIQILHFFELSGLLSHSVFWDISDASNSRIPQLQQSEYLLSKFPAINAYPRKIHVNTLSPNW